MAYGAFLGEQLRFVLRSSLRIGTDVEVIEVDRRNRSFFCCQSPSNVKRVC